MIVAQIGNCIKIKHQIKDWGQNINFVILRGLFHSHGPFIFYPFIHLVHKYLWHRTMTIQLEVFYNVPCKKSILAGISNQTGSRGGGRCFIHVTQVKPLTHSWISIQSLQDFSVCCFIPLKHIIFMLILKLHLRLEDINVFKPCKTSH